MTGKFCWIAAMILVGSATPLMAQAGSDFAIEPGRRVGPIIKGMTESALKAILPDGQMKRVLRYVGEGFFICGTEAFSGTPHAVFVAWSDMDREYEGDGADNLNACRALPAASEVTRVEIGDGGDNPNPKNPWRTASGLRLGATVREVQAAIGEPFHFSVCSCDFGGVVFRSDKPKGLAGIDLNMTVPTDADRKFKHIVNVADDYSVRSSDVPARAAKDFAVTLMIVKLDDTAE